MAKVVIGASYLERLSELDASVRLLNEQKIRVLFEALGIAVGGSDFALMLDWDLITVCVVDQQMAVQLNRLSAYIPNLKFVVDDTQPLFTVLPGVKQRRVWKGR